MSSVIDQPNAELGAAAPEYKTWLCELCGLVYNERDGWPEEGIPPGTRWQDVPDDWICPDCGTGKSDFEMTEI
jgi:rubredoxin-NAD+ reductase